MKSVLILCLLVTHFIYEGEGNFKDVIYELPHNVGHAFSVAWESLIDSFKRPVRSRRIGPAAKRRVRMTSTTKMKNTDETIWSDSSEANDLNIMLPFLLKPTNKPVEDGNSIQKPRFATQQLLSTTSASLNYETHTEYDYDNQRNLGDAGYHGPLSII